MRRADERRGLEAYGERAVRGDPQQSLDQREDRERAHPREQRAAAGRPGAVHDARADGTALDRREKSQRARQWRRVPLVSRAAHGADGPRGHLVRPAAGVASARAADRRGRAAAPDQPTVRVRRRRLELRPWPTVKPALP
ncbi:MAG: hypothetical protein ACK56I_10305, partial [bacterium]